MHIKLGQKLIDTVRRKHKDKNILKMPENNIKISLSNNIEYPQFCLNASLNDELFNNFRQNKAYQKILEHVDYELGLKYLHEIKKLDNSFLNMENITEFKKNDEIGNPQLFDFENIIAISGSTLRYIHVLANLKNIFKSLNNYNICEIGVGYGGQCRILSSYYKINSYTLVDLKPVLNLSQKYLDNYPLNTMINFKTMNELPNNNNFDLIISNYAFSEISREFQEVYFNKILKNSKRGFMIMNQVAKDDFNSMKKEELLERLPNNPKILEEIPLTHKNNYIIVWGEFI